jgi:hypothetical protein
MKSTRSIFFSKARKNQIRRFLRVLEDKPEPAEASTVERRFNEIDLFVRVAFKKPLLRKQNKRKRLQ